VTFIPTQTINYSGVSNVFINGGTARDVYGVGGQAAGTARTINGGAAFNEWLVFDDPENLDNFQAPVTLQGTSGIDLVEIFDYLNAAPHTYTVSANAISRDGIQPIHYSGIGDILLLTPLIGGSTVNVASTSSQAAAVTSIVSEAGDHVVVGADAGHGQHSMQSIAGLLVVTSRGGAATVVLDDSGNIDNGFDRTVTFTADPTYNMIIGGLAPANIYLPVSAGTNVSVIGNADDETFAIDGLPSGFNLSLDGEFGDNTLDYSGYTGDVSVNLALGTATGLSGIANFQNLIGSNGNSLLVGDANANVLRGGTGRNILIGGAGADQLFGGAGDNILIGGIVSDGTTDYDTSDAALEALMTEWDRTDEDFSMRIADLEAGVDANGMHASLTANTVHADQATDTLVGGGQNWFFVAQGDPDTVNDPKDGDRITPI
jgi:hypothetical protein